MLPPVEEVYCLIAEIFAPYGLDKEAQAEVLSTIATDNPQDLPYPSNLARNRIKELLCLYTPSEQEQRQITAKLLRLDYVTNTTKATDPNTIESLSRSGRYL